jgi:hypothetical protein
MDEAAATYAAWSPAVAPSWLRQATLADLGAEAPGAVGLPAADGPVSPGPARRRAAGAWTTPRPKRTAALLGATLLGVAFAALLLSTAGSLRQRDQAADAVRLPNAARSLQVADVPASAAARPAGRKRAARHARHARPDRRARGVAFVPMRAMRPVTSAPRPVRTRQPAGGRPRRPAPRPKRHPAPATPAAPAPAPVAPAPASADAPADQLPGGADGSATAAVPASAAQAPAAVTPAKTTATAPPAPAPAPVAAPVAASAPPAPSEREQDHDRGGSSHNKPCPPAPRCQRWSCRH